MLAGSMPLRAAQTNYLADLDISQVSQGWGSPHANLSVNGNPLSIGGQPFAKGLGTHAVSEFILDLSGRALSFSAMVGVDDEVGKGKGAVVFKLVGDGGKVLWQSQELHGGDAPVAVNVDLTGVKQATLLADTGDSIDSAHADWADAKIVMTRGRPKTLSAIKEEAVILTPKSGPQPRINSTRVVGVRPGHDLLYTIAATGDRPMKFSADNLPTGARSASHKRAEWWSPAFAADNQSGGLQLDPQTGRITGRLNTPGTYWVTLHARNAVGQAARTLKIVCGPQIGLTPALGWNSWNCFASAVTADKVKAAADAMVASGLINHGWTYINIDDYWEVHRDSKDPTLQGPQRDASGHIIPNPRFPDMKGLADYVHAKGLRIGLYSSPGPWTCGGCVASWQHEEQDAQSYAQWGFDYLKYDWCSYGGIDRGDTVAGLQKPYRVMRAALDKVDRDILFSFCQYGMGNVWQWGAEVGGNSWRTTGDINDSWSSMAGIGFKQNGHEKYAGPGHFNDPDMLVVGKVGWGPSLHPTHLAPNEQYTHISLWCLLASPLLIGCDMTQMDDFTLSLLTNDEVLEVNQDPLGRQAARVAQNGDLEIWAKDMEDGSKAVGLFNRGYATAPVTARWSDLGLTGQQKVRDLWRQTDLGVFKDEFTGQVPRHGVLLVRVWPAK
jgi:alpha-galactosidase